MYCLLALFLTCWSLLLASTTANPIAELMPLDPARRDVELAMPRSTHRSKRSLIRRDADTTFDLGFNADGVTLFDGDWKALGQTFSLSLSCVECQTWGTLEASVTFPDDLEDLIGDLTDLNPLNDINVEVNFRGVGALVDLSLATSGNGQFEVPLFSTETPLGISGPGFQVGIVFGVDLVLGLTGKVETEGGFQVSIPDDSSFTIPLDPTADNIAKFDGASASLLPLTASAPANVTAALRLRVQAGIELPSSPLLEAKALAGAYINIPEVILGEQFALPPPNGSTCILPASAEININAGVFIDIGADVGDLQIADFNPTLSTTLFSAAASTCFVTAGQATPTATATGIGGASTAACPVPLTTETKTTTSSFAVTSCVAPVPNCPASLTQVIVVSEPTTITSSGCPVSMNAMNATLPTAAPAPFANTTAPGMLGSGGSGGASAISLTSLTAPVTNTLTIDPSISAPDVPSITASPKATGAAMPQEGEAAAVMEDVTTHYVTVAPTGCACNESMAASAM